MQLKTSSCNKTVFLNNLRRLWPVWGSWLVVMLLTNIIGLFDSMQRREYSYVIDAIYYDIGMPGTLFSMGFGGLAALASFSFLYNHRSASWYHALPITRSGLFTVTYFSGLLVLAVPIVLIFIIMLIMTTVSGYACLGVLFTWLGIRLAMCLLFYSLGVLCAMLTGNGVIMAMVYVIFNVLVYIVEQIIRSIGEFLLFGVYSGSVSLGALSPVITLGNSVLYKYVHHSFNADGELTNLAFTNWPLIIGYVAAAVVFSVVALLIYRRRRTESAGDVVAVNPLKPVFRYCLGYGLAITLGFGLTATFSDNLCGSKVLLAAIPCMLICGTIGFFAAEMMIRKRFNIFRRVLPGFLCFAIVLVGAVLCTEFDVLGIEEEIPAYDEIEEANLHLYGADWAHLIVTEDFGEIMKLHQMIIANKDEIETEQHQYYNHDNPRGIYVIDTVERTLHVQNENATTIDIEYYLKDGSWLTRSYTIIIDREKLEDETSIASQLQLCLNRYNDVAKDHAAAESIGVVLNATVFTYNYDSPVKVAEEDFDGLLAALQADEAAGQLHYSSLICDEIYYAGLTNCAVQIEYVSSLQEDFEVHGNSYEAATYDVAISSFNIPITAVNTIEFLSSLDYIDPALLLPLA